MVTRRGAARRSDAALVPDDLAGLPGGCAGCLTWERFADGSRLLGPGGRNGDGGAEQLATKRRWWVQTLSAGTGGGLVVRGPGTEGPDGQRADGTGGTNGDGNGSRGDGATLESPGVVAYVTYAVPPRTGGDALTVLGLHVDADCRGVGLGRAMVQGVAREALRRPRIRAVEALGGRSVGGRPASCLVPLDFWLACGFTVVREHPLTPRVRLDARVLAAWRTEVEEAVEQAWGRLRGAVVRPDPVPGPALTGHPRSRTSA